MMVESEAPATPDDYEKLILSVRAIPLCFFFFHGIKNSGKGKNYSAKNFYSATSWKFSDLFFFFRAPTAVTFGFSTWPSGSVRWISLKPEK